MKARVSMFLLSLFAAPFMFAQDMKVGTDVTTPNAPDLAISDTRTDISLDPATASGYVSSVKVYWSDPACANAFMIAGFRRQGDLLTPIGERGPFTTTSNVMTINLTPPIGLDQGDLLGIVRIGNCGSVGTVDGASTEGYLSFVGDVTSNTTVIDGKRSGSALALLGSGPATNSIVAVFPAVGSVRGVFGSRFRTSLQLLNTTSSPMTGWLLFHPHGAIVPFPGNGSGYHYTIAAGQQISVDMDDVFTGPLGLGTLDVEVPTGQGTPQVVARVYNDAGSGGTAGFYEVPIPLADNGHVISKGAAAFMVTPVDTTRTRFNIGVRALFSGADLTAELLDNAGHVLASTTTHYPAGYFEQVDAASFFGGVPVGANKTIKITVTDGSAVVYGSTTDNVTNDPSVQYALVAPPSN
jgi:hypothetical protein